MKSYVIGVDVGGTNIKLGVVNAKAQVLARTHFATKPFASSKTKLITAIAHNIEAILASLGIKKSLVKGIGIGLPGLIDHKAGVVKFLPNIPGWRDVPLKALLEKKTGLPVFIDNDVKLITLGEWYYGAAVGERDFICMTLGTGVGSGLVLDNKLYRGKANVAGELGHVPLNEEGPRCNCGGVGCFETYVGNKTLLQLAKQFFPQGHLSLEELFERANKGDKKALKFWEKAATHIGNGLVGVVNLLNPSVIVIGGGVANNQKFLFKTIETVIKKRAMHVQGATFKIKRARLGNDAGIIGALALVNHAK